DTTAPTVNGEAITSATGIQNGTRYAGRRAGKAGRPRRALAQAGRTGLQLNIGGTLVNGRYTSGSGSNALGCRYTILAGETGAKGVSMSANALSLSRGTIWHAEGTDRARTAAGVIANACLNFDTTAPTVNGEAITSATGIQNGT